MKSVFVQISIVMAALMLTGFVLEKASMSTNETVADLALTISSGYDSF